MGLIALTTPEYCTLKSSAIATTHKKKKEKTAQFKNTVTTQWVHFVHFSQCLLCMNRAKVFQCGAYIICTNEINIGY